MKTGFGITMGTALLCGGLLTTASQAQEAGVYIGGAFGQAEHNDACEGANISCDEKDTAWKIFGGYQFNRYVAVELGYADLGQSKASGTVGSVTVNATFNVTAWELVGVGSFPVMDRLSVLGKAGFYRGEVESRGTGTIGAITVPVNLDESNTDITFGIGVRYDFSRNAGVRAEWQRYKKVGGEETGESDVSLLSVAGIWRF